MFVDEGKIHVRAGKGGDGALSFRREKFAPEGGPDGGDGGKGGDVIFIAYPGLSTLFHIVQQHHFRAQDGESGSGQKCYGKYGRDCEVRVPVGTIVRDAEHGHVLKDLSTPGERFVIAAGGKGGRGNAKFATSTRQAPRIVEQGKPAEERTLHLELKLLADVGLVGLPNAGKSTLLSRLSAARPKIAAYPFTTLHPYLGIVPGPDYTSLVLADLPGLIEGAHAGKGLGDRFLRHIERTRIILHLVDVAPIAPPEPDVAWRTIRAELTRYSETLGGKREIVVANKCELPGSDEGVAKLEAACGAPVLRISAVTGAGLTELVHRLFQVLAEVRGQGAPEPEVWRDEEASAGGEG